MLSNPRTDFDTRFLAGELAIMASEIERARTMMGKGQEIALGTVVSISLASANWVSGRNNLEGRSQALMELAKRIAWREISHRPIVAADVPCLADITEKARRIERHKFLSQYSEAVGAFKSALAELDRDWKFEGQRFGFLKVIFGGRVV